MILLDIAKHYLERTAKYFFIVVDNAANAIKIQSVIYDAERKTEHLGVTVYNNLSPEIEIFSDPIILEVFSTLIKNSFREGKWRRQFHG